MDRLNLWWQKRSVRDRRALILLGIVLPVILLWRMITVPLQDRLLMAKRVLKIKRTQAFDLQNGLSEYAALKQKITDNKILAETFVVARIEQLLRSADISNDKFSLLPMKTKIADKFFDTVLLSFNTVHPRKMWNILQMLYKQKVRMSEFEFFVPRNKNALSGKIRLWLVKE